MDELVPRTDVESLGVMVPLVDAPSVHAAKRIAESLNERLIPALVQEANDEMPGVITPVLAPGRAWVVVPHRLRSDAIQALNDLVVQHRGMEELRLPSPLVEESEDDEQEEPRTEDLEPPLPESGPLLPRVTFALGAMAAGAGAQALLEIAYGRGLVFAEFAARRSAMGEWWRLVTASFLHSGFSHQFWNATFGAVVGIVLLGTHGYGAVAFTWLISSSIGLLTELVGSPSTAMVIGASAGNYGLVGLWAKGQLDRSRVSTLPRRERLKTMGILLLLIPGALTPISSTGGRIAVLAHVAGFVVGFLLGYWFLRQVQPSGVERIRRRSSHAMVAACAIVALAVATGAAMFP